MKKSIYFFIGLFLFLACKNLNSQDSIKHPAVSWEDLPVIRTGVKFRTFASTNPGGYTGIDLGNFPAKEEKDYQAYRGKLDRAIGKETSIRKLKSNADYH